MLQNQAKILIVDDSATSRAVLRRRLISVAAQIIDCASAAAALELVCQHDFALILLDLQMPAIDGFEAIRRLRALPRSASMPVILMGARLSDPACRRLGYELGAVDCFDSKPIDAMLLQQKARAFIGMYQQRVELQQGLLQMQQK
ncbi:MAG: Response regulator receiver modulated diguanylate cyclase with sensor [Nevskia sp.]|nr:Response regulator receiver modulated diguanylate cyclase with sensor [Nevskia sp.]